MPVSATAALAAAPVVAILALMLALLGHAAGVSFGALGTPVLGAALFALTLHWRRERRIAPAASDASPSRALAPYAVLVVLVLVTRALAPLADALAARRLLPVTVALLAMLARSDTAAATR